MLFIWEIKNWEEDGRCTQSTVFVGEITENGGKGRLHYTHVDHVRKFPSSITSVTDRWLQGPASNSAIPSWHIWGHEKGRAGNRELVRSQRYILNLHREDLIQVFPGCHNYFPLFPFCSCFFFFFPCSCFHTFYAYNLISVSFFLHFYSCCCHHYLSEPLSLFSV